MKPNSTQKHSQPKRAPSSTNALPEPLERHLEAIAREMAGKPLSDALTPQAPLKQLIARVVELALEEELSEHLGYDRHQRIEPEEVGQSRRRNTRNGHTKKQLKTSHGQVEIRTPRDREATFEPVIVPKRGAITREVEDRVVAMYATGMTTRDIQQHVEQLYGLAASEMFVSRLVERLDPELLAWRNRPLEHTYAVVFVDGLYLKVRRATGVESTAAYKVTGYGESGTMEVLGVYLDEDGESPKERASFWHKVFVELEKRGLKQLLILCADGLPGMEEAARTVYEGFDFQPCVVHLMRNSLKHVPFQQRKEVARALKPIYQAVSYEAAELALETFEAHHGTSYPAIVRQWHRALPTLVNLWKYGPALRRLVYTTNPIENINRQTRKVTKNRGVLPNRESALRLLTLVLRRTNQKQRARPDWGRIVDELQIHFAGQIPEDWGRRLS